ncbi:type III-B CRISPR module RAMP protein Cmr4 [Bacteroidia bacterium]|nr:type III-B CRISPR module RAMP protein Cmr4 [Bacteroidia bacterium]
MSTIKSTTWLITAKTNLHAGNECSTGYGLIDKSVQRDALMGLPCINSSSLKGALNEYCCNASSLEIPQIHKIFGSDKKNEKDKKLKSQKGDTFFFDANILFMPVQDDDTLYSLVTCRKVINRFKELNGLFSGKKDVIAENEKNYCTVGSVKAEIIDDKKFIQLCGDDELPIIARNKVETETESGNLWYEQIIPPEAVFYTFLQSPTNDLENAILENNEIVQIGANATIGYGYCKFIKL